MTVEKIYTSLLITATIATMAFIPTAVGQSSCYTSSLSASETAQNFTSPGYPNTNSRYSGCQWYIRAVKPSQVILLKFLDFSLTSNTDCYSQYVTIYDGIGTNVHRLQTLCGQISTTQLTSTGPSMTVVLHSLVTNNYRGFKFEYSSQEKPDLCGNGTLVATETAENFTSIGYPNPYPGAFICQWTITAESPSQVVVLKSLDFSLMNSFGCYNDHVAIYDGNSTDSVASQTLCGEVSTTQHISSGSSITVVFQSDGLNSHRGYKFEYSSQEKSALCGNGSLSPNGTSENITSPGYPYSYPGDTDCLWSISAELPSQVVVLKFLDFSLWSSTVCHLDYLTIYDGNSTDSQAFPSLCGQVAITQFISSGPLMTVAFHSDKFRMLRGFKFEYTTQEKSALCGIDNLSANQTSQSITSPGYPYMYPNNMDCQWHITADSPSHVIVLSLKNFILEDSFPCAYDSVSVYDGSNITSDRIEQICGQVTTVQIMSTGPNMTIVFHSDDSIVFQGFDIEYSSMLKSDVCRDNSLSATGLAKNITSMNYPYNYPNNLNCQWVIKSNSSSEVVVLNILDFYLESSTPCGFDYVTIYDGSSAYAPQIFTTCGQGISGQFTSTGRYMTVVFHSDDSNSGRGFNLQYISMDKSAICSASGLTATSTAQHISSPGYPHNYPSNKICEWHITADSLEVIMLELEYFYLEYSATCLDDYLTIYDGPNIYSPTIISLCGSQNRGAKYVSSGSTITVVFNSDESVNYNGFQLKYTSQFKTDICSYEVLTATYSIKNLDSPNYPGLYPSNMDCQWHISTGSSSQVVQLDMSQFSLQGNGLSCYSDYVKIYDGASSYATQMQVLCGDQYYGHYVSTGSDMTVVFHSNAGNYYKTGFRFTYQLTTSSSSNSFSSSDYFSSDYTGTIVAVVLCSIAAACFLLVAIILVRKRMAQNRLRNNQSQSRVPVQNGGTQVGATHHMGMQNPQMVPLGVPTGYTVNYLPPPPYFYAVQGEVPQPGQNPQLNNTMPEKSGAVVDSTQDGGPHLNKGFSSDLSK